MNWSKIAQVAIPPLLVGIASAYGGSEIGFSSGRERRNAIREERSELVSLVGIMAEHCDSEITRLREEGALPSLSKKTYDRLPENAQMAIPPPQ